jgi:hypothetical protein
MSNTPIDPTAKLFASKSRWLSLVLFGSCLFFSSLAAARDVEQLADIQREARITADVIRSALREQLPDGVRATSVTAEYLARQGVLVTIKLNSPWLVINDDAAKIQFNGRLNLEEIPIMVENILTDLNIDLTPYEPEALEALRALREEQRELRLEQRELRSELRKTRRSLVRAENDKARREFEEKITRLERELHTVDAQYDELAADIDEQYQVLRDYRGGPTPGEPKTAPPEQMTNVIARAVCDYGGTLRSLNSENYLTTALRRNENTEYLVFKMDHVFDCSNSDISWERLLELAYQYQG